MRRISEQRDLAAAVWRTWGARGIARRTNYELAKRSGRIRRAEAAWLADVPRSAHGIGPLGVDPQPSPDALRSGASVVLYGALDVGTQIPPDWHRHPLTGFAYDANVHWSALSDATVDSGDIKDLWELSRFGWLFPTLRRWATDGDDADAERIWTVFEHWVAMNPAYVGPHWMCAQETSLRAITMLFLADALRASAATTPARQALVAALVRDSVGRVKPTMGYALSQRNNHAISEAGFLWSATVLVDNLPEARRLRRTATRSLAEAVSDQFDADGSYAQHSPTYHRLALHVLLWCLFVERVTGEAAPEGVADAVRRSVPFLRSLLAPGSAGRVPNMGGNDGALLFALVPTEITDFRPVIAHAAASTDQASGLGPGPWDAEAAWFGWEPTDRPGPLAAPPITVHSLSPGTTHAVLRAGRLQHRPAHADQLHTDVWLRGVPVAVDAGSYRYTAPSPWGNALADEGVHNVPRREGAPQATRGGRFFWRRWTEANVTFSSHDATQTAVLAELRAPDGTSIRRLVAATQDLVVVIDEATRPVVVRWNLVAGTEPACDSTRTEVHGSAWRAVIRHGVGARSSRGEDDAPSSGWHAPTYAVREPLIALEVPSAEGRTVTCFTAANEIDLDSVADAAGAIDLDRIERDAIAVLLRLT